MLTASLFSLFVLAIPTFAVIARPSFHRALLDCDASPLSLPTVTVEVTLCRTCPQRTKINNTLSLNYNGTLAGNGSLFDSSYNSAHPWPAGEPFNVTLGNGDVIEG